MPYLTFSLHDPLDREFRVGGYYSPGRPAQPFGPVENFHPAEPDELTIDSIKLDGKPIPENLLTDAECEALQAKAEEKAREAYQNLQEEPEPPPPYTREEHDRDNPYNQWMQE